MFDVVIVGGGPAGSTAGTLLKKYRPDLRVLILEREAFPRDHVGESQLPGCAQVLHEMGCWDKVEAANFPIKVGATYRWGKTPELWDFDFLPHKRIRLTGRPGKYEGQRKHLAFQVDRAIYDKILLDHARTVGCEVREETRVVGIDATGDRVNAVILEGGEVVHGSWFMDASGHAGIIRRSLGIEVESPTTLQNIAIWDYWQNAKWAERIGVGGTRIQVMSVGYGWLWFIPLGPTRTSLGLVIPKVTFKELRETPQALYDKAVAQDPLISDLLIGAYAEGNLQTTRDWSFLSKRHAGENWFLVGESSGFADPILSAGLTITHTSAKEAAYSINTILGGEDPKWVIGEYDQWQSKRILNHIRFADYWYTANTQFGELQEFTAQLARESGLDLGPAEAWAWLAQGGFIADEHGAALGGINLKLIPDLSNHMGDLPADASVSTNNVFRPNLEGARLVDRSSYSAGKVKRLQSYVRRDKIWPLAKYYRVWFEILKTAPTVPEFSQVISEKILPKIPEEKRSNELYHLGTALEALIADGWVVPSYDPRLPLVGAVSYTSTIHWHERLETASVS